MAIRGYTTGPKASFVPQHGMNQQSAATQHLISTAVGPIRFGVGRKAATRKKKRAAATARSAKGRRTTSRSRKSKTTKHAKRMVKGSAAAKAWMKKIRKLKK